MKYRKSLVGIESMIVPNKPYADLPVELQPFHYYFKDAGHVIMCVPNCFKIENGYIFIDVLYNKDLGIVVDEKYYEF